MTIKNVVELVDGQLLCGDMDEPYEFRMAFSSDLMSDVLTLERSDILLITGLINSQVIRTAEMADIRFILFVRDKQIPNEVIDLANKNGMSLVKSPYSLFRCSGLLYGAGIQAVY